MSAPARRVISGLRSRSQALSRALIILCCLTQLFMLFYPSGSSGHLVGEAVPIACVREPSALFAANTVAAYFEEQMGRRINLLPGTTRGECLDMLRSGRAPMAVLDGTPDQESLGGVAVVEPALVVGEKEVVLVMGEGAAGQLQFSLVPAYMERLGTVLTAADWGKGLARVRSGEGIRKAAIDMLRDRDLI